MADWPRYIDGYPTLSGGLRLHLTSDGSFVSFDRLQLETAPVPKKILTSAQIAPLLVKYLGQSATKMDLRETLGWWTANSALAPYKLCWEINFQPKNGDYGGLVVFDAETGEVVETGSVM